MASFTNAEKVKILHRAVKDLEDKESIRDVPYTRPQLWAAAQAIRDIMDGAAFRTAVSDAIDDAIAPATMSAARKKRFFGRVLEVMVGLEVL